MRTPPPAPWGIDTDCLIYLIEGPDPVRLRWLTSAVLDDNDRRLVIDSLTVAELMVKPLRERTELEAVEMREAIEALPRVAILDVDISLAIAAAKIRAATGLKLPDAVHMAAAVRGGAQAILTNDAGFKRASAFLPVLILDELIAGDATTGV